MIWNNATIFNEYLKNYIEYTGDNYSSKLLEFQNFLNSKDIKLSNNYIKQSIREYVKDEEYRQFENKLESDKSDGSEVETSDMTGIEFESYLGKVYESLGYTVEFTPASNDYGADLILSKFGQTTVVQAKRYRSPVGVKAVQEIIAAIKHYKANDGIIVTNSTYTNNAIKLAKENNIQLVDANELKKLIKNL